MKWLQPLLSSLLKTPKKQRAIGERWLHEEGTIKKEKHEEIKRQNV
jgi:hypothetical protein